MGSCTAELHKYLFSALITPENTVSTLTQGPTETKKSRGKRPKVEAMPTQPPPEDELPPEHDEDEENEAEDELAPEELAEMADAAAAPAPPRKRGRPRAGSPRPVPTEFFERWNATPNFRESSQYWIYRLEPITDLVATGRDKYVAIFQEECDEDKIMRHPAMGSGVYMIIFKTRNEQGQMNLRAKYDRLDIENLEYPPCIPPGAWLDDRRNARWGWAKRIYDKRTKEEERLNAPPPPPMTVQDTMAIVENAIERKLSSAPKESPLEAVKLGLEMARQNAPPAGASDVITTALLNNMQRQIDSANARADAFEKRLLDAAGNPTHATGPVTIEEQAIGFAKVVEAVDKVRPPKGGRGPVPEQEHPGWKLANTFLEGIAPGLNVLIRVGAEKLAGQPAAPQPQRQANRPQQAEQQPAAQQVQQAQPIPSEEVRVVEVPAVLQQHFQTAFDACMQGLDPDDFAHSLNDLYPTAISELRQIGSENPPMPWSSGDKDHAGDPNWGPLQAIMDIARHQSIWKFVAMIPNGEERLTAFVKGVLEWVPSEEEDESEDGVIQ